MLVQWIPSLSPHSVIVLLEIKIKDKILKHLPDKPDYDVLNIISGYFSFFKDYLVLIILQYGIFLCI